MSIPPKGYEQYSFTRTDITVLASQLGMRINLYGFAYEGMYIHRVFATLNPAIRNDILVAFARSIYIQDLMCRDQPQEKPHGLRPLAFFPQQIPPHLGEELYTYLLHSQIVTFLYLHYIDQNVIVFYDHFNTLSDCGPCVPTLSLVDQNYGNDATLLNGTVSAQAVNFGHCSNMSPFPPAWLDHLGIRQHKYKMQLALASLFITKIGSNKVVKPCGFYTCPRFYPKVFMCWFQMFYWVNMVSNLVLITFLGSTVTLQELGERQSWQQINVSLLHLLSSPQVKVS